MKPEDNKRNEPTMLVNKENQDVFLVVPNVVEGERYFIIRKCDLKMKIDFDNMHESDQAMIGCVVVIVCFCICFIIGLIIV